MKKKPLIMVFTSLFLLVSCNIPKESNSTSQSSLPIYQDSSTYTSENESNSEESQDTLELFMYGELYLGGLRSIYVKMPENISSKVIWTTSNDKILTVEAIDGPLPEALLHSLNVEGEVTITATLKDNPSYHAKKTFNFSKGEEMPEEIFDKFKASSKFTFNDQTLDYDENYVPSINSEYDITTIYEENKDSSISGLTSNLTDAYQLTEVNKKTNETKEYKYVRSNGNQLAKEKIDIHNNVSYELVYNDDSQTVKYDNTYYTNPFGNSYTTTNKDWRSFDNGKTYHFLGGYLYASYICASLLLVDISPDDMYFTIDNDKILFNLDIDPYNSNSNAKVKYGRKVSGEITDFNTAKIDHIKPFEHETYHTNIATALTNMANLKNYQVNYEVDYPGLDDDLSVQIILTSEAIDQKVTKKDGSVSHTGIHKKDDGTYYSYNYDETTKKLTKDKDFDTPYESDTIKRYPTFDFASEIFANEENGYYTSRGNNGVFINYTLYAPSGFSYYNFNQEGSIKLSDDKQYVSGVKATFDALGDEASINATFSNFTTAKIDIDFSTLESKPIPTSWETDIDNKSFYDDLKDWKLDKYILYKYVEQGWSSCGWSRNVTKKSAFVVTHPFKTQADLDTFIKEYGQLLIDNGYTLTKTLDENNNNSPIYEKDGVQMSIGYEVNSWNDKLTLRAKIYVYANDIVPGGTL